MNPENQEFDAFRIIVSLASEANNADFLIELLIGIGLKFDLNLNEKEAASHLCRIRALRPRALLAYDGLTQENKLAASNAAISRFFHLIKRYQNSPSFQGLPEKLIDGLSKVGWEVKDNQLFLVDPQVREMFFPKGSQWDAFVAIRDIIDNVKNELTLVDPYCDRAFFGILESSKVQSIAIRILCRNNPTGLKAEAQAYIAQKQNISIQLRTSPDFHDRFLILDKSTCVHLGASINHAGSRAFMLSTIEDIQNKNLLINAVDTAWNNGKPV